MDVLCAATIFISTHKQCENQAYNINNGDLFRWKELWPKIAKHFGLETGPNLHINLTTQMGTPDKKELWDKIVKVTALPLPLSVSVFVPVSVDVDVLMYACTPDKEKLWEETGKFLAWSVSIS